MRSCVIERGLENCAACEKAICNKLTERLIDFEEIQTEYGKPVPKIDRQRFILPYENV